MATKLYQVALRFSLSLALFAAVSLLIAPAAKAQEVATNQNTNPSNKTNIAKTVGATNNTGSMTNSNPTPAAAPVFTDYKGVRIGMSANEVRDKLGHLKEKGPQQDYFVFSDEEFAQVYYDKQGKVKAISISYMGDKSNAPSPQAVLGEDLQTNADGSTHKLKRYPSVGYWVAYSRTAGKNPVITVTMQKMRKQ